MRIWINGEQADVRSLDLGSVLSELGYADAAIATAVNGDFVSASLRAGRSLQEGDRVEVLAPMQGG